MKLHNLEEQLKYKKEKADKISSEIIPNILAEQGSKFFEIS